MRDLLLGGILLFFVLAAFRKPWIGIMGWTWVGLMNPHQLTWRLNDAPVAAAIAASTLLGLLISSDRKNFFLDRENAVFVLLTIWMGITTAFAVQFEASLHLADRVAKINLMLMVALVLLYSKRHMLLLTWILVLSMAWYGVKGGLFTIATGGNYRVWGPTNTYIEGNNELAVALVVTIPLMRFLQTTLTSVWAKRAMTFSMLCMAASAIGSHSRGALLAISAMAVVMWWRSDRKLLGVIGLIVVLLALLPLMPEHWWNRMETIKTYDEDASALGRLNAWATAFEIAKARITGGGFFTWNTAAYVMFSKDPTQVYGPHSIYFQMMGEHGFIGLFLYLLMWFLTFFKLGRIRKKAALQPETQWLVQLGAMGQVSLVGFAVGGAFLGLANWDLPYNIMVLAVIAWRWMDRKEWLNEKPEPLVPLPAFLSGWGGKKTLPKVKP
ncbi:MAG: putative O-glycosylation ligase, exosortase A system-associated [Burkholderiales bacterium]